MTTSADAYAVGRDLELIADRFFRQSLTDPHAAAARPAETYQELRPRVAELGWFELSDDASFGGSGAPRLTSVLFRAAGRALAPGSFLEDLVIRPAAGLGSVEGPFAFVDGADPSGWEGSARRLRVRDGRLVGSVDAVPHAYDADWFLVAADRGPDLKLLVIARDEPGLTVDRAATLDPCSAVGRVGFDVPVTAGQVLCQGDDAHRTLTRVLALARLALSAELHGLASEMLRRSVDYALERHQFGRPIGSFQAVKHLLAEMACDVDSLGNLLTELVDRLPAADAELRRHGAVAKVHASRVAVETANRALQVHGGIGFTEEYVLQLYIKRALVLEQRYGSPSVLSAELGADLIAQRGTAGPS